MLNFWEACGAWDQLRVMNFFSYDILQYLCSLSRMSAGIIRADCPHLFLSGQFSLGTVQWECQILRCKLTAECPAVDRTSMIPIPRLRKHWGKEEKKRMKEPGEVNWGSVYKVFCRSGSRPSEHTATMITCSRATQDWASQCLVMEGEGWMEIYRKWEVYWDIFFSDAATGKVSMFLWTTLMKFIGEHTHCTHAHMHARTRHERRGPNWNKEGH